MLCCVVGWHCRRVVRSWLGDVGAWGILGGRPDVWSVMCAPRPFPKLAVPCRENGPPFDLASTPIVSPALPSMRVPSTPPLV